MKVGVVGWRAMDFAPALRTDLHMLEGGEVLYDPVLDRRVNLGPLSRALVERLGQGQGQGQGVCAQVPALRCQGGMSIEPVPGCQVSCYDGRIPARLGAPERMFTAEIDLSGRSGPGEVLARVYTEGGCVAQGGAALPAALPSRAQVDLFARGCPPPPRTCQDHLACGGSAGQVCGRDGWCADPPQDLCPGHMTFVPAGELQLGDPAAAAGDPERACPGTRHRVTRPLCVDLAEATVARWREYLSKCRMMNPVPPTCSEPWPADVAQRQPCTFSRDGGAADGLAVNCVSREQAEAFCRSFEWKGQSGRLPTEAEWEWIAGRDAPKHLFPWSAGETPQDLCAFANGKRSATEHCESDSLTRVRPPGRTPAGNTPSAPSVRWPRQPILDLGGNLAEWVADAGDAPLHDHCALQPRDDPRHDGGDGWLHRGGSFDDQTRALRVTARARVAKAGQEDIYRKIGVRCVLEATP